MSVIVSSWVWQHSTHKGGTLLLLLAIAEHAHDDGDGAYPSIETLAKKVRMSERHTTRLIQELVESGELAVRVKEGPRGANIYRVTFCNKPPVLSGDKMSGDAGVHGVVTKNGGGGDIASYGGGDIAVSHKPSLTVREPEEEPEDKSKLSQNPQNQENSELQEDSELWPKWYALGYAIPGWKVSFEKAEAWRVEAGIPEQLADIKIYALREWWARLPKDGKRSTAGDPYMTWQNWCRQDRDKWIANNGGGDGKPHGISGGYSAEGDNVLADPIRREALIRRITAGRGQTSGNDPSDDLPVLQRPSEE